MTRVAFNRSLSALMAAALALCAFGLLRSPSPARADTPCCYWLTASTYRVMSDTAVTLTAAPGYVWVRSHIEIHDLVSGQFVASCGPGVSTCTATVSRHVVPSAGHILGDFQASVVDNNDPSYSYAASAVAEVRWDAFSVSLAETSVSVSTATYLVTYTLTATTNHDVGPTPFWIAIYRSTGASSFVMVGTACGGGATCTGRVVLPLFHGTTDFFAVVTRNTQSIWPTEADSNDLNL